MRFWLKNVLIDYIREKWPLIMLILVFFCAGIFFGALAAKMINVDQAQHLSDYLNGFLEKVSSVSTAQQQYFRYSVLNNFYVIIAIGILGLTVIGIPLVLVTLFSRGFVLGFTVGFLVREKALKGLLFAVLSVLPHNLIAIPAVLVGSLAAVTFSAFLIKRRFFDRNITKSMNLWPYVMLMLFLCLMTGVAGMVETYITPMIIKTASNYLI